MLKMIVKIITVHSDVRSHIKDSCPPIILTIESDIVKCYNSRVVSIPLQK